MIETLAALYKAQQQCIALARKNANPGRNDKASQAVCAYNDAVESIRATAAGEAVWQALCAVEHWAPNHEGRDLFA